MKTTARPHHTRSIALSRAVKTTAAGMALALPLACGGGVPAVTGGEPVLPKGPQRQAQALSSPSADDASSGSGAKAWCKDGALVEQSYDPNTGDFASLTECAPGGGIASIRNAGNQNAEGDGAYDQITTFEDGGTMVWHFTVDSSDSFTIQDYTGVRDDGTESYVGHYAFLEGGSWQVNDTWNMREGVYVTTGVQGADGVSFDGHQSFDDLATALSPDWEYDYVSQPDGSFSQDVHFSGDGFSSDYTYAVNAAGDATYVFATDLDGNALDVDFEGSYAYNADGSGSGDYVQHFEDGSLLSVHDDIHADTSMVESWTFDDASTELDVDQEGSLNYAADGSAEGSYTLHSVGGESQTCQVHLTAGGAQTIDHCS